jgi:hypothetical protein
MSCATTPAPEGFLRAAADSGLTTRPVRDVCPRGAELVLNEGAASRAAELDGHTVQPANGSGAAAARALLPRVAVAHGPSPWSGRLLRNSRAVARGFGDGLEHRKRPGELTYPLCPPIQAVKRRQVPSVAGRLGLPDEKGHAAGGKGSRPGQVDGADHRCGERGLLVGVDRGGVDVRVGPDDRAGDPLVEADRDPLRTVPAGELVHMDVKKFGRIPDDGGWRVARRAAGSTSRVLVAASSCSSGWRPTSSSRRPTSSSVGRDNCAAGRVASSYRCTLGLLGPAFPYRLHSRRFRGVP